MDDAQLQELAAAHPELADLYRTALAGLAAAADEAALEGLRVSVLGRKSRLTEILRSIPQLAAGGASRGRPLRQPGAGRAGAAHRRARRRAGVRRALARRSPRTAST